MATYAPTFEVTLMLCDSAASAEGKLYIQGGGWDSLMTMSIPFHQPRLGLAIIIRVPWTETNKVHTFKIELEDQDGKVLGLGLDPSDPGAPRSIDGQFNLGRPPMIQPGDAQAVPVAINLDRQRFDAAGTYSFVMKMDDEEVGRLPFRIGLPGGVAVRPAR